MLWYTKLPIIWGLPSGLKARKISVGAGPSARTSNPRKIYPREGKPSDRGSGVASRRFRLAHKSLSDSARAFGPLSCDIAFTVPS